MTWPALVRPELCRVPVSLHLYGPSVDEDGAPEEVFAAGLLCHWQDGAGERLTERERTVRITGRAYFPGDVCPELPVIAGGWAEVFGARRRIVRGRKARNPDGTVNYTEVRLE